MTRYSYVWDVTSSINALPLWAQAVSLLASLIESRRDEDNGQIGAVGYTTPGTSASKRMPDGEGPMTGVPPASEPSKATEDEARRLRKIAYMRRRQDCGCGVNQYCDTCVPPMMKMEVLEADVETANRKLREAREVSGDTAPETRKIVPQREATMQTLEVSDAVYETLTQLRTEWSAKDPSEPISWSSVINTVLAGYWYASKKP